jgi:short subunit dehydrogenase-like uncharacterized protein
MKTFLIYGSYGYTGGLIVEQAVREGLRPMLAGRDGNALRAQASRFDLEFEAFDLEDRAALKAALLKTEAVLHCAGPFSLTYRPMIEACLAHRRHYIDISGEIEEFEALAAQDEQARQAGVMILPGAGFDVVPSDCLARYLSRTLPGAERLELDILGLGGGVSRGTASSGIENMHRAGRIRREGRIVKVPNAWRVKPVDFGHGRTPVVSVGWGDVSTAYYTTNIPNIEVYMALSRMAIIAMYLTRAIEPLLYARPVKEVLKWLVRRSIPPGPSRERNRMGFSLMIGEVSRGSQVRRARLRTPEAYHLTAMTSVEVMKRTLAGDLTPGFQTPARAYGEDFILGFPGVVREDL